MDEPLTSNYAAVIKTTIQNRKDLHLTETKNEPSTAQKQENLKRVTASSR